MKILDKNELFKKSMMSLEKIYDMISRSSTIKLKDLHEKQTALIMVDMVNGFAREGALKSSRIEELISEIVKLSKACDRLHIQKLTFADCHSKDSPEFDSYPSHCIEGSNEGEIIEEIKQIGGYILFSKNSTNGFLEEEFQKWIKQNEYINTFIIVGNCTDICIQQFALTLKAWFNMQNEKVRIIIPINAVETYDIGLHNGDLMNIVAIYSMIINGIEVVAEVK